MANSRVANGRVAGVSGAPKEGSLQVRELSDHFLLCRGLVVLDVVCVYVSRGGGIKQWIALGYRCEDTPLDQQVSASSTTVIHVLMLWAGKIEIGRELRYFRTNVVGGVGECDRPTSRSLAVF